MFRILLFTILFMTTACQNRDSNRPDNPHIKENPPIPKPVTFKMDSQPILIKGAKIMTAAGQVLDNANLYMAKGLIQEVSEQEIKVGPNTEVIDGAGLTITPGLIDVHSHMGVYPSPNVDAHEDGNEMSRPVTADVWAEHAFWPQDPDLWRALAGGVTTIQVLPGSANLIGGRSFTAKLIPKVSAREMRFPGAPQGLKMACGENPKRVYKDKGLATRMGNMAGYRKAYQEALEYLREQKSAKDKKNSKPPKRNFVSETLMKVLQGEILVHFHCYRADDISAVLDLAKEFGFKIKTIQHGLEAYKVADRLAKDRTGVATWADWWGFKAEAFDGIPYNAALLENAGAKTIIHSDSPVDVRFLNIEAAKALASAKKLGLKFTEDQALAWVTKNPAWALGIEHKVGTIQKGKQADVVLWDGHPFSIYSKTQKIFINGKLVFDRQDKKRIRSDFEVGFEDMAFHDGREYTKPKKIESIHWSESQSGYLKTENRFLIENLNVFINGQFEKNTSLLIQDGKITAINPKTKPKDIQVLDGRNRFLTPGFIDSETHLGLFEIELDSKAQDYHLRSHDPTPHFLAYDALNMKNIRIPIFRSEGVTTAVANLKGEVAAGMGVAFDLAPNSEPLDGSIALFGQLSKREYRPKKRSAIWAELRNLIYESEIYLRAKKEILAGRTYNLSNLPVALSAMEDVLTGKIPWVLQANRVDDITKVMELKKRILKRNLKIRFAISGGAEAWMVSEKLKQEGIPVILTPSLQTPQSFDKIHARFDLAAKLQKDGVEVIIADHNQVGSSRLRQEAGFAVRYGLDKNKALESITTRPAKLYKLDRGEIKAGAVANLVLWSHDPLEPTSQAEAVWIHGVSQRLDTRQLELAKKYMN